MVDYILKNFIYNENGTITRSDRKNSNGSIDGYGYLILKIKGKQYKAHRIVWLLCNGDFPECEIDHINRNKTDNRIENLRLANRTINNRNVERKPNKETKVVGVYIDKTKGLNKKYTTRLGGKTYRFYTISEAINKRREYYNDSL